MESQLEKDYVLNQEIAANSYQNGNSKSIFLGLNRSHERGDGRNFSVIFRDLSFHCQEEHLIQLLEENRIQFSKLLIKRSRTGKSLLHAFADFQCYEDACQVIDLFNGYRLFGRAMRLELCDPNLQNNEDDVPGFQIHVHYKSISNEVQPRLTEEEIQQYFHSFGDIVDTVTRNHSEEINKERAVIRQEGYAFIYFAQIESALNVIQQREKIMNKIKFICELSHRTKEYLANTTSLPPAFPRAMIPNIPWSTGFDIPIQPFNGIQDINTYWSLTHLYQPPVYQQHGVSFPVFVPPANYYHPINAFPIPQLLPHQSLRAARLPER